MLSYFLVMLVCHNTWSPVSSMDNRFSETMKQSLEYLCPGANICNTSAPIVNPNAIIGDGSMISCCRGCSCHKDCGSLLTCCFPDEDKDVFGEEDIGTNNITSLLNASIGHDESHPDIESLSMRQCLYAQTGPAGESWPSTVPAYIIVSKPPPTGCTADMLQQTDTASSLQGSCGPDNIAPWGDLFPVYSSDRRVIYKNERCARCHGENEYIPWIPTLVCDAYDPVADRDISMSEHFAFLEQDSLSNTCFVSFHYPDSAVMVDNRCFIDTIDTCSFSASDELFPMSQNVDLTAAEITAACNSGLNAPIRIGQNVYRNIFCALCNRNVWLAGLRCAELDFGGRTFGAKLTYLLDTAFILENTRSGKNKALVPFPRACMRTGNTWDDESCRNIYCPSGQIRNTEGNCESPSKLWHKGSFAFLIRLTYINNVTSILTKLKAGLIEAGDIAEAFNKASPWPSYWEITRALHTSDDVDIEPSVAVELVARITRSGVLINDIKESLKLPWTIVVKGTSFLFKQSSLEYTLTALTKTDGSYIPLSTYYVDKLNIPINMSMTASTTWTLLFRGVLRFAVVPYLVSKLLTCDLVSLKDGEYSIMANHYLLVNNLTGRILYDREFELIEDGDKLVPRVCLADSPFELKFDLNDSVPLLADMTLHVILVFTLVVPRLISFFWLLSSN